MAASSSAPVAAAVATAASGAPLRSSRLIRRVPFFYGWVVLGVGTLGIVMMGPSQSYTVSLFLDHFVQDLGISRATASLIYGVATLTASLLLPLTGRLVDRYGTRRLIALNALVFGLALMAMSQVSGPWTLLVGLLLVRYLGFGSMQLISNNAIAQWFILRRGLVMGVAGQSLAISLLFFPWLSNQLINDLGWRQAWVVRDATETEIAEYDAAHAPAPDWTGFGIELITHEVLGGWYNTLPMGIANGLSIGLKDASQGDPRLFIGIWQKLTVPAEVTAALGELMVSHHLPAEFIAGLA